MRGKKVKKILNAKILGLNNEILNKIFMLPVGKICVCLQQCWCRYIPTLRKRSFYTPFCFVLKNENTILAFLYYISRGSFTRVVFFCADM